MLLLWATVEPGAMAIKGCFTFAKTPALLLYPGPSLGVGRGTVGVFYSPSWLAIFKWRKKNTNSDYEPVRTTYLNWQFGWSPLVLLPINPPVPFNNPLMTVAKAAIMIGIITFMFLNFFNSLARSRYLSFFSLSFSFILWSAGTAKSTILQVFFFFFLFRRWLS